MSSPRPQEAPTEPRRHRVRRTLALIGGGILLLLLLAVIVLHTPPARRHILNQVTDLLATQRIDFNAEALSYNLLELSLTIEDVRVQAMDAPDAPPFAVIPRAEVDLSLLALLGGRYVVESGGIDRMSIHYFVDETGQDNLPRPPSQPDQPSEPLDYLVERFSIGQANLRYENREIDIDARLPIDAIDVVGDEVTDRHAVQLAASGGEVRIEDRNVTVDRLSGLLDLGKDDVAIEEVVLEAAGSRVRLAGEVERFEDPVADLTLDARVDAEQAARLAGTTDPVGGTVEVHGTATGPVGALDVVAQVTGSELRFRELTDTALNLDAAYDMGEEQARISDLQVTAPWGRVSAQGVVSLEPGSRTQVMVRMDAVDAAAVARGLDLTYAPATLVSLHAQATLPGLEYSRAEGQATLVLTSTRETAAPNVVPVAGRLEVNAGGNQMAADVRALRALGADVNGRVTLLNQENLGGVLQVDVADLSRLISGIETFLGRPAGSLVPTPVSGASSVTARIDGTLEAPHVAATVNAPALTVGTVPDVQVAGAAVYRPDAVDLNRLEISWRDARVHATGRVGLAGAQPLDLAFGVEQARIESVLDALNQGDVPASGTVALTGTAGGTVVRPTADVRLQASDLEAYGETWGSLTANVTLEDQEARLTDLVLEKPQPDGAGRLSASGRYHLDQQTYAFDLDSENLRLVGVTLPDGTVLQGDLSIAGSGTGSVEDPSADVDVVVDGLQYGAHEMGRVVVDAAVADGRAILAAAADRFGLTVDASAAIEDPYPSTVELRVADLDLAALPLDLEGLEGQLQARLDATADLARPRAGVADLTIDSFAGSWNAQPFAIDGPAVVRYADERVSVEQLRLTAQDAFVDVSGDLPLSGESAAGTIELDARADLSTLARYAPADMNLRAEGLLTVAGEIRGSVEAVDPRLVLTVDDGAALMPQIEPGITNMSLRAVVEEGLLRLEQLSATYGEASVEATGRAPFDLLPELPVAVPRPGGLAELSASVTGLDLATIPGAPEGLTGRISLDAEASAAQPNLSALTGRVSFPELEVTFEGLSLAQQQPSSIVIDAGTATVERFDLSGSAGRIEASGSVGLTGEQPLDLRADGELDIAAVSVVTDAVRAEGPARLQLTAGGTIADPALGGFVELTDATVLVDDPGIAAESLSARLDLAGDRVTLTTLSADLNGGTLSGSGFLTLGGEDAISDVELQLAAEDFAFEAPLDLRSMSDFTLSLDREGDLFVVSGQVTLAEAGLTSDINLDTGLLAAVTASRPLEFTEARNPLLERMRFEIDVDTATPVIVDNNLARAEASLDLRVLGTPYETGLSGRLTLLEGSVITLNERRYQVERGDILFVDERQISPSFDLQLMTSANDYDITLTVTGPPDDTETVLTADPTLPEPDIMALLLTGRTLDQMRGEEFEIAQQQALSYLTGRATSGLGRQLEQATGLSEVRIEPNLIANEANPSARLTVGQDLTDDLALIYSMDLTNSSDQIWVVEYDLTRRFQTRTIRQADNTYRLEFLHDVRFGGRPAPGRQERTRPIVDALEIVADQGPGEEQIRDLFGVEEGDPYDFFALRDGMQRVEDYYRQHGWLQSRVRLDREVTDQAARLTLRVVAGPVVELEFQGMDVPEDVRREVRREWQRGIFDTQRAGDAVETLRGWLMDENHLDPSIEWSLEDPAPGERLATFRIDPGNRFETVELVFAGAQAVDADVLRDIIHEQDLERRVFTDAETVTTLLERYYREQGYLTASLEEPVYEFAAPVARVRMTVDEGPQYVVDAIDLTGNDAFEESTLIAELPLETGAPFLPVVAERSLERIRDFYWERGYNDVRSELELTADRDAGRVAVAIALTEGPKTVVEAVRVAGNEQTSDRLVREQVALEPSTPLDLGELGQSRRNLYETGAFSLVEITRDEVAAADRTALVDGAAGEPPSVAGSPGAEDASNADAAGAANIAEESGASDPEPAAEVTAVPEPTSSVGLSEASAQSGAAPGADESDATDADTAAASGTKPVIVNVGVREVQPFRLRYGASYDTERGIGGVFDLSNQNSLGKARVLGLSSRYDGQVREARVYFSQPSLRYWPVQTLASVYVRQERNPETRVGQPFAIDRRGVSVQQERTMRNAYVWNYGFRYEEARTFDPRSEVGLDERVIVSPLTSAITRETRDEVLDATTGSFLSQSLGYSPSWLGSDQPFLKYFGQYFKYVPLEAPRRKRFTNEILRPRFVYAAGLRIGFSRGLGGPVPRSERFFAGGSTSLRGFEQNAVGPLDADGIPSGGNALLVLNNELRFPLVSIFDGVAFVDIGNVFDRASDFSLADLRESGGVGLRVRTPWFLLRGDYGIAFDPRPGEPRSRFYFSIGQAF